MEGVLSNNEDDVIHGLFHSLPTCSRTSISLSCCPSFGTFVNQRNQLYHPGPQSQYIHPGEPFSQKKDQSLPPSLLALAVPTMAKFSSQRTLNHPAPRPLPTTRTLLNGITGPLPARFRPLPRIERTATLTFPCQTRERLVRTH